jgi:hypothetical protein
MVSLRLIVAIVCLGLALSGRAQSMEPSDPPLPLASALVAGETAPPFGSSSPSADPSASDDLPPAPDPAQTTPSVQDTNHGDPHSSPSPAGQVDADGNPIPLERQQPQRILGFMPNFRSVSGGAKPHPPGWKYNFTVATHQATDYSSFIFLGITSLSAE